MSKVFTTAKGTELPLLNLRGNDYLEVKYRLVWFREEHPNWSIETEFVSLNDRSACARAMVRDESGRTIATSHKLENCATFPDFMEKAETGAIGRALALIGYGTQFCADDLEEGDRIVDAPVSPRTVAKASGAGLTRAEPQSAYHPGSFAGEYVIRFGKKYMGKKVKDIPRDQLESYVDWIEANAEKKGQKTGHEVELLKEAMDRHYNPDQYPSPKSPDADSGDAIPIGDGEHGASFARDMTREESA